MQKGTQTWGWHFMVQDWVQVGVSSMSGSAGQCLTPLFSFPASHYYKYKQQFIFPGKSL